MGRKAGKQYLSDKPCMHGHIGLRRASDNTCVQCNRNRYDAWHRKNPGVALARTTAFRKANPDKWREYQRRYTGLPEAPYPPPGYCEICCTVNPGKTAWNMDHNHDTNEFRGWLCRRCNIGIGLFNDDSALTEKAAEYLRKRNQNGKQCG